MGWGGGTGYGSEVRFRPSSQVGWVERSETHRHVICAGMMGFASLYPSYELHRGHGRSHRLRARRSQPFPVIAPKCGDTQEERIDLVLNNWRPPSFVEWNQPLAAKTPFARPLQQCTRPPRPP